MIGELPVELPLQSKHKAHRLRRQMSSEITLLNLSLVLLPFSIRQGFQLHRFVASKVSFCHIGTRLHLIVGHKEI
jgi:hypothetical protein